MALKVRFFLGTPPAFFLTIVWTAVFAQFATRPHSGRMTTNKAIDAAWKGTESDGTQIALDRHNAAVNGSLA